MDDRDGGKRGLGRSSLAARHDYDEDLIKQQITYKDILWGTNFYLQEKK